MGGRAFGFDSKRMDKDEYEDVLALTLARIDSSQHITGIGKGVLSVHDKTSFGDIDILVCSEYFSFDKFWEQHKFRYKEYISNGGVTSILDKQNRQIDIISTPKVIYQTHFDYLAYNDLGNFVGRIARSINLKYGHDGLTLIVRSNNDETRKIGELRISRDTAFIYKLLDIHVPANGFKNMQEVFDAIMGSKYYHKDLFLLDKQSNKARVRDRKRKSYNDFLAYITLNDTTDIVRRRYTIMETLYKLTHSNIPLKYLHMVPHTIPTEYVEMVAKYDNAQFEKTLYNGNIVRDIVGLEGKALGAFMGYMKEHNIDVYGDITAQVTELFDRYNTTK